MRIKTIISKFLSSENGMGKELERKQRVKARNWRKLLKPYLSGEREILPAIPSDREAE